MAIRYHFRCWFEAHAANSTMTNMRRKTRGIIQSGNSPSATAVVVVFEGWSVFVDPSGRTGRADTVCNMARKAGII